MSRLQDMSNFPFISMTGPKMHSGSVYSVSCGKTYAGTIFPSFEHNWLKWSFDKYNTQRQFVGV